MRRRTATEVLRDHARERWLRRAVRSANLDGDLGGVPRMGETAWVESCLLTAGVDQALLDVLGVQECEAGDEAPECDWNREAAEHLDIPFERMTEKWAHRVSMAEAAKRLGLELDHKALKAMRLRAIATVTENQLRRRAQEGRAA